MHASLPARALIAAAVLAGLCATPAAARPAPGSAIPGEVLVGLADGSGPAERAALERRTGVRLGAALTPRGTRIARVGGARTLARALARLERDPAVRWAEPNRVYRALRLPGDPLFGLQWGLRNTGQSVFGTSGTAGADIGAAEVWDVTTGSEGVRVAVLDGGVDLTSPDLAPNIGVVNLGEGGGRESNGVDDDGNGLVDDWRGWDFVDHDADPVDEDPSRHGTIVAGVIGARGGDGTGIAGVSWNSRIIPVRGLDETGFGTTADLAAGITYASQMGARILNASFGGAESLAVRDAIAAAPQMLVVAAAGNGGGDGIGDSNEAPGRLYPCSLPLENVVCVAASGPSDTLASFSNYGVTRVDLAAPGVTIVGPPSAGGTVTQLSGTSFAAPHAAGVAALVLAAEPGASTRQLRRALLEGAEPLPSLAGLVATGGRLHAPGALAAIPPAEPGPGGVSGPAVDLGPSAARLTGTLPASSEPLAYHFAYGPTTAYGAVTPTRAAPPGAERIVAEEVRDLPVGAALHHRLVVAGLGGITLTADVASRTPPAPPPPASPPSPSPAPSAARAPAPRAARAAARPTARVRRIGRRWFVSVRLGERSRVSVRLARRLARAGRRAPRHVTVRGLRRRALPRGTRRLALGALRPGRYRVTVRVVGSRRDATLVRTFTARRRR